MYPYVSLPFGVQLPSFGLLFIAGAALGILADCYLIRQTLVPRLDVFYIALYAVIGAIVGAKALFILTVLPELFSGELPLKSLLNQGMVFYGGLIGGIGAAVYYCGKYKLPVLHAADALIPGIPLAHAVGRIGCFCAGCCYGLEYTGPGAIVLGGVSRFPVQLAESALLLALFAVLTLFSRQPRAAGRVSGLYLTVYALMRFGLEFLRGDAVRGALFGLSTSQWISMILLPFGLFLLLRRQKNKFPVK